MPSAPGYGFDYYGIQLGQHRLAGIIRKHAQRRANFKLRYATRFVSLEQHNNGVTIQVDDTSSEGKRRVEISARFVVGCDGGTSPVRKFLSIPFEGYTWERWRFLAINIKCAALAAAGYGVSPRSRLSPVVSLCSDCSTKQSQLTGISNRPQTTS